MSEITKGIGRGFGGCLGVLAAVIIIPAVIIALGRIGSVSAPQDKPTDPKDFCQAALTEKLKATPGAFLSISTDPKSTGEKDGSIEVSWLAIFKGRQIALTCRMKPDGQSWTMEKITGGAANVLH
jgi:hypothetical protein